MTMTELNLKNDLRNAPVQTRSQARLNGLLDAARVAYDVNGRDNFTTGQVAEQAGASIGTIYRYYSDRVKIMDAIHPDRDKPQEAIDRIKSKIAEWELEDDSLGAEIKKILDEYVF